MSSPSKSVYFRSYLFHVSKDVYYPAEDTFLLAENVHVNQGDLVLDMGTGCGILAILAADKAQKVVAIDVNPQALRCTQMNAERNGVAERVETRLGNLFEPVIVEERFNLVLFNAPYLPSTEEESNAWLDRAWSGGPSGRRIIDRFLSEAPKHITKKGKVLLVQSTLSDIQETLRKLEEQGLSARILAKKKVAFEKIVVIAGEYRHSNGR